MLERARKAEAEVISLKSQLKNETTTSKKTIRDMESSLTECTARTQKAEREYAVLRDSIKGLVESAARVGYDDELPGKDAHSVYGVNHAKGAAVVIRPDLWTGISVFPDEGHALDQYFGRFLL